MQHIVSLSGGLSSAVTADRVIQKYGRDSTTLWFADTLWEDPDLYRFLSDLEDYFGVQIVKAVDGQTPLDVAERHHVLPNNRMAYCSQELKQWPFKAYLKYLPKPVTVHLGLDWTELHRHDAPKKNYEAIPGVTAEFPLMWKPVENRTYAEVVESWGVRIPALYTLGFPHNNCGGRCIRQGKAEWLRLFQTHPERYAEVEEWERQMRQNPKYAKHTILREQKGGVKRHITLEQLRLRDGSAVPVEQPAYVEDRIACFCEYY